VTVDSPTASGLRRGRWLAWPSTSAHVPFAEAERYIPQLLDRLEAVLLTYHLTHDDIVLRMTGCPNGCARPYLGEIGLVGRAVARYNLYLGAAFNGERLNKLYK